MIYLNLLSVQMQDFLPVVIGNLITKKGRAFITTQSVKKLKAHLKEWALSPTGWHLTGSKKNL